MIPVQKRAFMPLYIEPSRDLDRCHGCLTHSLTTLKDRATQLLIKYKSRNVICSIIFYVNLPEFPSRLDLHPRGWWLLELSQLVQVVWSFQNSNSFTKYICQLWEPRTVLTNPSDVRDSEMMRKFVGLDDPEDRVFGAFVMGKVCPCQSVQTKVVVLQQYRNESFWCFCSSVDCQLFKHWDKCFQRWRLARLSKEGEETGRRKWNGFNCDLYTTRCIKFIEKLPKIE